MSDDRQRGMEPTVGELRGASEIETWDVYARFLLGWAATRIEKLEKGHGEPMRTALHSLVGHLLALRQHNATEWMSEAATRLNLALQALGSQERVVFPGRFVGEFTLHSGSYPPLEKEIPLPHAK